VKTSNLTNVSLHSFQTRRTALCRTVFTVFSRKLLTTATGRRLRTPRGRMGTLCDRWGPRSQGPPFTLRQPELLDIFIRGHLSQRVARIRHSKQFATVIGSRPFYIASPRIYKENLRVARIRHSKQHATVACFLREGPSQQKGWHEATIVIACNTRHTTFVINAHYCSDLPL
jgi:hypothetical protein